MTSRAGRGSLAVRIIADSSQFKRGIKESETATETFKGKMVTASKVVAGAILFTAGRAVTSFVRDSKQSFIDLNESLNAVQVVFGDSAEGIKRLGANAARSVGLSTAEFNALAVSMANFAQEVAGPGGDVVAVVDEMTTRIADFASVMNLEVPEAAQKFQSGLAGQSRPLREFGIDVSDAAVQQFALANGIGETSRQLTEGEKVQARYGLIMQQTEKTAGDFANTSDDLANSLRIAAAEAENNKAITGAALEPAWRLASQAGAWLARQAGNLALEVSQVTGQISNAERATRQYMIATGLAADTAEDAIAIWQQGHVTFQELIPFLNLTRDELEKLADSADDLAEQFGWTSDEIEQFKATLAAATASQKTAAEEARFHAPAVDDVGDAYTDAEESVQSYADTLRATTDPVFGAIRAQERLKEAQDEATKARSEHGAGSAQHVQAILAEAEASVGYKSALEGLAESGIATAQDLREMLKELGLGPEAVNAIVRELKQLDNVSISDKGFRVNVQAPIITYTQAQNMLNPQRTGIRNLQRGGIVEEGLLDGNRSRRKEAVIPLETQQGKDALASAIAAAIGNGSSNGSNGGINLTVHAGLGADGHQIGDEVVRALEQWKRRNGPLPF